MKKDRASRHARDRVTFLELAIIFLDASALGNDFPCDPSNGSSSALTRIHVLQGRITLRSWQGALRRHSFQSDTVTGCQAIGGSAALRSRSNLSAFIRCRSLRRRLRWQCRSRTTGPAHLRQRVGHPRSILGAPMRTTRSRRSARPPLKALWPQSLIGCTAWP